MQRFREWMLWIGWRRIMFTIAVSPLAVLVAWWMLRLPPPPIESMIPVAPTIAPKADATSDAVSSSWLSPLDTVAPERVAVHVVGAVSQPGVYHLVVGSRADDAVQAAGGPTVHADLRRVNLAALLHDGEQLVIPRVGERVTTTTSVGVSNRATGTPQSSTSGPVIVDVNRATVDDLDRLPGVGPSTAKAIIDHRTRNGPFASIDELLAVRGIGPAKLAEIRPWVRV